MSIAAATKPPLTPEEFLALDHKGYELIDGVIVPKHGGRHGQPGMSLLSSYVAGELAAALNAFCKPRRLAWVFPADTGFRCFPEQPRMVREPDVAVVLRGRLPAEQIGMGWGAVAPDIAVEVISPRDEAYEVDAKIGDYLEAGVRLVWVIYPPRRRVLVYRADGSVGLLNAGDRLDGEGVLPGFACPINDLFPTAGPVPPAAEPAP